MNRSVRLVAGWATAVLAVAGVFTKRACNARDDERRAAALNEMLREKEDRVYSSAMAREAEHEYRPGGARFGKVWDQFYNGDHEPELDDPLIAAGQKMTGAICEAVAHKDMKLRRYALSALGFIGDKRAIPSLEKILKDPAELDYFRGDALHAIYQIDEALGSAYAKQYENEKGHVNLIAKAIKGKEAWLKEPSEE